MMTFLSAVIACGVVAAVLGSKGEVSDETMKLLEKEPKKYDKDYCRQNLDPWYFDNWRCEDIAYQLKDNWVREDLEYLMRHGYSFEMAVNQLVEDGKMNL